MSNISVGNLTISCSSDIVAARTQGRPCDDGALSGAHVGVKSCVGSQLRDIAAPGRYQSSTAGASTQPLNPHHTTLYLAGDRRKPNAMIRYASNVSLLSPSYVVSVI